MRMSATASAPISTVTTTAIMMGMSGNGVGKVVTEKKQINLFINANESEVVEIGHLIITNTGNYLRVRMIIIINCGLVDTAPTHSSVMETTAIFIPAYIKPNAGKLVT